MIPAAAERNILRRPVRGSIILKMSVIGALILLLLIPLGMVRGLIAERAQRRDQVVGEIAAIWGHAQTLGGPVLLVPYQVHSRDTKGKIVGSSRYLAYFLPETLKIDGRIQPERRSRGIFEAAVYQAELRWAATFRRPGFSTWRIPEQDVLWDEAALAIGVPDMRGIRRAVELAWEGRKLALKPGGAVEGLWTTGLRTPVPGLVAGKEGDAYNLSFDMAINGSSELMLLPFGQQTTATLRSTWPDPSFTGAFLPESRKVGPDGFEATWNVPYFGRGYPQQWLEGEVDKVIRRGGGGGVEVYRGDVTTATAGSVVAESAFGVGLFLPVDAYQKTERSVKYGALFLLLTFLTFFLYEVFNPFSLHPLQYLLVGAALCLFYLLLLSISEHVPFGLSYAIASAATIGLIAGYSMAILRGRLRALGTAGALAALYGYLYVLLQAEDYALLLGSIGLFAILALVMYATRRIDWYAPRPAAGEGAV